MNCADHVLGLKQGRLHTAGVPAEALESAVIANVWGAKARWLEDGARRALVALD